MARVILIGALNDIPAGGFELFSNSAPVAMANGPYPGNAGSPITFDGTGSFDPDSDELEYEWDFGDGNNGTGPTPTHTYMDSGVYTVCLSVTDPSGTTDTDCTTADIAPAGSAVPACGSVLTVDSTLESDLHCVGTGLIIGADNITLDLNGLTLSGSSEPCMECPLEAGVLVEGHTGVTIKNGAIIGFVYGVFLRDNASGNTIENVVSTHHSLNGFILLGGSDHNHVSGCTGSNNGGFGLIINNSHSNLVENCAFYHNTNAGLLIFGGSSGNTATGNTATQNGTHGINLNEDSVGNFIHSNSSQGNVQDGIGIRRGSSNNQVYNNIVSHNQRNGIRIDRASNNNQVTSNQVIDNLAHGIHVHPSASDTRTQYVAEPENNLISENVLEANGEDQPAFNDITDGTTDSGDFGTRNHYQDNVYETSLPAGLCSVQEQESDLSLAKTVDQDTPNEGDTINFSVTVTNHGPGPASGVQVTDLLPAGLTLVVATPYRGAYDVATGLWDVGDLAVDASATLTLEVTLDAGTGGSEISNTAEITASDQDDPVPDNNRDTVVLHVTPGVEPEPIDALTEQTGMRTSYSSRPSPDFPDQSPAGVLTITVTWKNITEDRALSQVYVLVTSLTNGNWLLNADDGPGQEGARLSADPETSLGPGESDSLMFQIGMTSTAPFAFFVEGFGVVTVVPE